MKQSVSLEPALIQPLATNLSKAGSRHSGGRDWSLRKADKFLIFVLGNALLLMLLLLQAHFQTQADLPLLQQIGVVVGHLEITDLCLSTEARYTRHLSQSDWHGPFQDHPLALEHFPTGSIFGPPPTIRKPNEQVD